MHSILLILVGLTAIPVFIFTFEVLCSLLPRRSLNVSTDSLARFSVLIPAHNESGTIEKTLINIKDQLSEHDRMLVVADNCSDDTAAIARNHGADVIERTDTENRGKGFALDFGVKHLAADAPEVVIIIDADCLVSNGALKKLAAAALKANKPIQALYLMKYATPSLKQRISEFAWLVKNHVRPLGLRNVGLPCQLMGTGMAFPWPIISNASLATGHVVEDMKMGLEMGIAGHAPIFLPDVSVTSTFPESSSAEQTQKKRWEHGHLITIFTILPKIFVRVFTSASKDLLAMGLDLVVPPLALLTLISALLFIGSSGFLLFFDESLAFTLSFATLIVLVVSVLVAWLKWGRATLSFTDLLMVPVYVAGKIPLYVSAVFKRQKEWIRTERD